MRVLHCPEIVGGNAQQLARSERDLGLQSKAIAFRQNYLLFETDEVLLPNGGGRLRLEFARWRLMVKALSYDVIHYNFGQTIFPACRLFSRRRPPLGLLLSLYSHIFDAFDLRLFRLLGKGIIVTFQGDDARQGDYCREHFAITIANEVDTNYYNLTSDSTKRKHIEKVSRYANRIYALNPDLLRVLPKHAAFLPYAHLDLDEWRPVAVCNEKPVLVHAPSDRAAKGTRFLLNAIKRLKSEGVDFEFLLIEGLSRTQAKKQYEKADLLVDQLLAGWYGGVAVEFMALAKPVIAYIRNEDLDFIPDEMRDDLPIINATPDGIYEVLKYWLTDGKQHLQQVGHKSRSYVEKWHDPLKIAMNMKIEYETILRENVK